MSDYIEREAAIEAIKKERDYTGKFTFEEEHAWAVGFQQGITFALSDVANIPAADVRPVVRAKWKRNSKKENGVYIEWCECSACRETATAGASCWDNETPFCPWCGADMRTGAE